MFQHFGELGEGTAFNLVRQETYVVPEGVSEYTKDFIECCKPER